MYANEEKKKNKRQLLRFREAEFLGDVSFFRIFVCDGAMNYSFFARFVRLRSPGFILYGM